MRICILFGCLLLLGGSVAAQQSLPVDDIVVIELRNSRCIVIPPGSTYTQTGCREITLPSSAAVSQPTQGESVCVGACFKGEYVTSAVECKYEQGSTCKIRMGKIKVKITHVGVCKGSGCTCEFEELRYPITIEDIGGIQCL